MRVWQRLALPLLALVVIVFGVAFVLQLDATRDARREKAATAAQVETLTDKIDSLTDALAAANTKIDALGLQVQSLGGEPVATSANATTSTTPTTPTTTGNRGNSDNTPSATRPCKVNVLGICV